MSAAKHLANLRAALEALPSHNFFPRVDGLRLLNRDAVLAAATAAAQRAEMEELSKVAADRLANATPAPDVVADRTKAHEATIAAQNTAIAHMGATIDDLRKELASVTKSRNDFVRQVCDLREKGRRVPVREMAPATD